MKGFILIAILLLHSYFVHGKIAPFGKTAPLKLGSATSTAEKLLNLRGGASVGGLGLHELLKLNSVIALLGFAAPILLVPAPLYKLMGWRYEEGAELDRHAVAILIAATNWPLSYSEGEAKKILFMWTAVTLALLDKVRKGTINLKAPLAIANIFGNVFMSLLFAYILFA